MQQEFPYIAHGGFKLKQQLITFNMDDLPVALLIVMSAFDFSEICSFCSDFGFDVLEMFVDGHNALFFYDAQEWQAAVFYCVINGFAHYKYISS